MTNDAQGNAGEQDAGVAPDQAGLHPMGSEIPPVPIPRPDEPRAGAGVFLPVGHDGAGVPPPIPNQPYSPPPPVGVGPGLAGPGPTTSAAGRMIDPHATQAQRQYCMFMHLTLVLTLVLPLLAIIVPLVMWQLKRDESAFVDDHGRETVNFHITLTLYLLASVPLMFVCGLGIPLAVGAYVLGVVGCIMGSIAANKGEYYRYPMCIRLLK